VRFNGPGKQDGAHVFVDSKSRGIFEDGCKILEQSSAMLGKVKMNYDTKKTQRFIEESQFIIHGFLEQIFCKCRQIGETRHDEIPYGASVGSIGELFDVKRSTTYTLRGKKTVVCAGVPMQRVIIPICGRLKKKL
tara:strand:- start:36 stop:440 length:405 start_codon:yes stop_codon:yes gene_type:complete